MPDPAPRPALDADLPRGLYAAEAPKDLDEPRSIKLRLPLRLHIRLHALRLHRGAGLSETVAVALERYFEQLREEERVASAE